MLSHYLRMNFHRIYFLSGFIASKDADVRFGDNKLVIYGIDTKSGVDVLCTARKHM